jgi:hypothetical protein
MKRASSFFGLIAASFSLISLTGCGGGGGSDTVAADTHLDPTPLCALAPTALGLIVTAVSHHSANFAQVEEFVNSRATDVVISGGCKGLVNRFINDQDQQLSFDLELPDSSKTTTASGQTLMQCMNWSTAADRVRCFTGEISPP